MTAHKEKKWFVLYTKPNFEKKVFSKLTDIGVETYLPLRTTIRKWSDRKKRIEAPLFPGYIFILGNEKERFEALSVSGVVRSVMFRNEPATLRDEEIENIKKLIRSDKILETSQTVVLGAAVRITSGPLKDVRGVITEIKGKKYFTLVLESINSSIFVDVQSEDIVLL